MKTFRTLGLDRMSLNTNLIKKSEDSNIQGDTISKAEVDQIKKGEFNVITSENMSKYLSVIKGIIEKSEKGEELTQDEKSTLEKAQNDNTKLLKRTYVENGETKVIFLKAAETIAKSDDAKKEGDEDKEDDIKKDGDEVEGKKEDKEDKKEDKDAKEGDKE